MSAEIKPSTLLAAGLLLGGFMLVRRANAAEAPRPVREEVTATDIKRATPDQIQDLVKERLLAGGLSEQEARQGTASPQAIRESAQLIWQSLVYGLISTVEFLFPDPTSQRTFFDAYRSASQNPFSTQRILMDGLVGLGWTYDGGILTPPEGSPQFEIPLVGPTASTEAFLVSNAGMEALDRYILEMLAEEDVYFRDMLEERYLV